MRAQLQPAYLLHRRPYRDSSQLLELLTAQWGRVGAVARGVRRRARGGAQVALLRPFTPLLVSLSGRGELKTLTAVEAAGNVGELQGDALLSGFYVNEVLVRLLHRDAPAPGVFSLYASTLAALAESRPLEPTLRHFERQLLAELGYALAFDHDCAGIPVNPEFFYHFEPGAGLRRCRADETGFHGEALLSAAGGDYSGAAARCAKLLLRQALADLLGDQPLRSRQLFVRRSAERTG